MNTEPQNQNTDKQPGMNLPVAGTRQTPLGYVIPAPAKQAFSMRQAMFVLFFRKRLILGVGAVVVLATIVSIIALPPRYHSEAKLYVRPGGQGSHLDPTASIGQTVVPMEGRDKEINSEIELLKSRTITEQIVNEIGANRLLNKSMEAPASSKDVAAAITLVESKLSVEVLPDTEVLLIGYDAPDPALARDVIAKLIDRYEEQRVRVFRSKDDLKFFKDQETAAQADQAQYQQQLRELRDSSGIDNPDQQRTIVLTRVDGIQHDIDAAKADLAATISSIDAIGKELQGLPTTRVVEEVSGAAMDSKDTLRTKLSELRLQEADLKARYRPDAPPLLIIRQQIAEAEKELAQGTSESSQSTVGVNHSYEELSLRRDSERANQASLESRIASLTEAKLKAQSGLAWIDEVAVKAQALEQKASLAATNLAKYSEAYEQARIDQQMGQERIGNISVAEAPVLPLQPSSPGRGLLAIAGLFLAVSLGVGVAFIADTMDHTIRRVEHLQALGLNQTVSVPMVTDYYGPLRQVITRSQRISLIARAGARAGDAESVTGVESHSNEPISPLKALMRPAFEKLESPEMESPARDAAADTALETMDIVQWPAGPLAVSPTILAVVRGVVEQLIPLSGDVTSPRVIGVIGPRPHQGASTISVHLAVALAHRADTGLDDPQCNSRALLIDADLESPTASLLSGVAGSAGLGDWIQMRTANTEPLMHMILPSRQHSLDVLPAGAPRERSPLSARMPQILSALAPRYQHVILDIPSMLDSEASVRMAALCDAVVLVCEADELRMEAAQQALLRLRDAGAKIAVSVLNKRSYPVPEWAYRIS